MRRVEKPWGHELIWAETARYVGKLLVIREGQRLSLQYHRIKEESLLVQSGRVRLQLEGTDGAIAESVLEPGAAFHVAPGRRHRFEAVTDCVLVEVSTPELDDVVRIADDYGRDPTHGGGPG